MKLIAGSKAPAFSLESGAGRLVRLGDLAGKWVVLYFYPKDNTPGCTAEACGFRDAKSELDELGAAVFGVSPDEPESHKSFAASFDLNFTLLADPDHATAEDYGVWMEKNFAGKKYWGMQRATFLIDPEGNIAHIWPKVSPEAHAAEVREKLAELIAAR